MTTLVFMNSSVDALLNRVEGELLVVTEMLKDTGFPLEDRWEVYLKVEALLPRRSDCIGALEILTDCAYDDLYMDRYQSRLNSQIDEQVCSNYDPEDAKADPEHYSERAKRLYERRDEWREAVLAEGYGTVVNDW